MPALIHTHHPRHFDIRPAPAALAAFAVVVFAAGLAGWLSQVAQSPRLLPSSAVHREGAAQAAAGPEPALLLSHAAELGLGPDQRQALGAIDRAWAAERSRLEEALAAAAGSEQERLRSARGAHGVSLYRILDKDADYSELSRRLESLRRRRWEQALAVLTSRQREAARGLLPRIRH